MNGEETRESVVIFEGGAAMEISKAEEEEKVFGAINYGNNRFRPKVRRCQEEGITIVCTVLTEGFFVNQKSLPLSQVRHRDLSFLT